MTTEKTTDLAKTDELTLSALRPAGDENAIFFNKDLFAQAQRAAELLSKSQMIPDQYRNKMPDCFIALASANRLNVDVFAFMQNSYVVHGRPGMEAKLIIALVNTRGPFDGPIQWKMEGEGNNRQCTAYARHAETKELCEFTVTWEMVVAEGWNKKKGAMESKWITLPDLMFRYRSATFLARLYCPEVIQGITTVDELHDIQMAVSPSGIYEKEEGQSPALPTEDLFHKEFIHHKHAATVEKINEGVAVLAEKFNVSEEEIKKTALEDPDAFRVELKNLENKEATTPPETPENSAGEASTSPNETEEPPPQEEESNLPSEFGEGVEFMSENEKQRIAAGELMTSLTNTKPEDLEEVFAGFKKGYLDKFPKEIKDEILAHGNRLLEELAKKEPEDNPRQVKNLKAFVDQCKDKLDALEQVKKNNRSTLSNHDWNEIVEYANSAK